MQFIPRGTIYASTVIDCGILIGCLPHIVLVKLSELANVLDILVNKMTNCLH